MIGTKFYKSNYDKKEYAKAGIWCNSNNAMIQDKGEYYEVVAIPPLSLEEKHKQIQEQLTDAVQKWMDKTVQQRNYDNILSACSYAGSKVEKFNAEGTACQTWRDEVWKTCYKILDEVLAGTREIPTEEELINELPVLVW